MHFCVCARTGAWDSAESPWLICSTQAFIIRHVTPIKGGGGRKKNARQRPRPQASPRTRSQIKNKPVGERHLQTQGSCGVSSPLLESSKGEETRNRAPAALLLPPPRPLLLHHLPTTRYRRSLRKGYQGTRGLRLTNSHGWKDAEKIVSVTHFISDMAHCLFCNAVCYVTSVQHFVCQLVCMQGAFCGGKVGGGLTAAVIMRDDTDKLIPATGATAALSLSKRIESAFTNLACDSVCHLTDQKQIN